MNFILLVPEEIEMCHTLWKQQEKQGGNKLAVLQINLFSQQERLLTFEQKLSSVTAMAYSFDLGSQQVWEQFFLTTPSQQKRKENKKLPLEMLSWEETEKASHLQKKRA